MSSKLKDCYATTFGQAMVSAAVLWAALPPLDLWPLAWIAPVWWILLIRRRQLPGHRPYRSLWLVGFLFWLAAVHWVRLTHWSAYFGWVALAFYLAFYLPVFMGLSRVAVHRFRVPVILAAPMVWTGLELARGHLLTGFTMGSLGHTQYHWIDLIQLSDLAGAYGVSFVVMFVAACLGRMIPCERRPAVAWPLVPAVALIGAVLVYGHQRVLAEYPAPQSRIAPTRIALIQGSIDTEIKFDPDERQRVFQEYYQLSQRALRKSKSKRVDLIVWPETMFRDPFITYDEIPPMPDGFDGTEEEFRQDFRAYAARAPRLMAQMALALDTPLVLGVDRHHYYGPERPERFNSAVFVAEDGELSGDYYDKVHLVMFGEYVPFVRYFPALQRITPVSISLSHGTRWVVFKLEGGLRIAPNICYETVIPHVIRRQVNSLKAEGNEPDVLVNLTNDGWFRGSSELDMHLACGVFRAVECRKPLLIAANTGFSAFIDGNGVIRAKGLRRKTGTILADVAPDGRESWYLKHGDWPAGICLAGCVALGLAAGLAAGWARIRPKAAGDER
jgi:apolipoprotein N-acyltransferase